MKSKSYTASIFIGGNVENIKNVCRQFCVRGLCVSVTPTEYIFTGGSEAGAIVGLINYPRFEVSQETIKRTAFELARALLAGGYQRSCTIVCPDETEYLENPTMPAR